MNIFLQKLWSRRIQDPIVRWIKLNFYGASKQNPRSFGVGALIGNHKGDVLSFAIFFIGMNSNISFKVEGLT